MSFIGDVKSFLVENFWSPLANEAGGYNIYNTAAYSGLFALAAAYIGFPVLKKLRVDLDRRFFLGITPYIFMGGTLRSLEDIKVFETILLKTPLIYILMFSFTLSSLYLSLKISEMTEIEYHKIFAVPGLLALIGAISFFRIGNIPAVTTFLSVTVLWVIPLMLGLKEFKPELFEPAFYLPVAAHLLDASSTYTALQFGGSEKHVLANFFINIFGAPGIFIMKLLIIPPAVLYIYRNVDGEKRNYYLFLVALLGFAIATRNTVSMVYG